jgi:hypothetical protein
VLNELNISIYEDDEEAIRKWKHFMEANKWTIKANYIINR